jgi:hypothetical protein
VPEHREAGERAGTAGRRPQYMPRADEGLAGHRPLDGSFQRDVRAQRSRRDGSTEPTGRVERRPRKPSGRDPERPSARRPPDAAATDQEDERKSDENGCAAERHPDLRVGSRACIARRRWTLRTAMCPPRMTPSPSLVADAARTEPACKVCAVREGVVAPHDSRRRGVRRWECSDQPHAGVGERKRQERGEHQDGQRLHSTSFAPESRNCQARCLWHSRRAGVG